MTAVRDYSAVDASKVEIRCKELGGKKFFQPVVDGDVASISLTPTTDAACTVVYGIRTDGQFERPGFLDGAVKSAREGLSMTVKPTGEVKAFLQQLDEATEKAYRAAGGKGEWSHLVADRGNEECFKCKVVFAGKGLTEIKVRTNGGKVKGSGWAFAEDLVEQHWGFKNATVMLAVRVHSVWCVSGRAGLSLHASWLYVLGTPAPAAEQDPFEGM